MQSRVKNKPDMLKRTLVLWLLLSPVILSGQVPDENPTDKQEQIIEDFVERSNENFEFETYFEYLNELKTNPLDLNKVTFDDLSRLALLSNQQVNAFIDYRDRYGPFETVYELQGILYFDLETIQNLLLYTGINETLNRQDKLKMKRVLKYGRHQLILRTSGLLEQGKGYQKDTNGIAKYEGNRFRYYARYLFNYKDRISVGFTAEKDPGEAFFTGSQKQGFDFYSGHIFINKLGKIKHLAIGDYEVKLGQGLMIWSGFGIRKSPSAMSVKRNTYPLRRSTSVNENRYLRGVASTIGLGNFELTLFGSMKRMDGNLDIIDSFSSEIRSASSLQESGLHRTVGEINDKYAVSEKIGGAHLKYRHSIFDIGISGMYSAYDPPLKLGNKSYSQFRFTGRELFNGSIDYTAIYRSILFFGETALSQNGGWATLNGLVYNLDHKTAISLLYRNFQKDYQAVYANAFAESSTVENEEGFYLGLSYIINSKLTFEGYMDFFNNPWLRYQVNGPGKGVEFLGQLNYKIDRNTLIYIRAKNEQKTRNLGNEQEKIKPLTRANKTNVRVHFQHNPKSHISLRSRLEWSWYKEGDTKAEMGIMFYQDINYRFVKIPLNLSFRYALFNIPDFDARVYAYEKDLLYQYSVPFYNGKGSRIYLVAEYAINQYVKGWIKVGQYYYPYVESIGSGLEEIQGNSRTEVKVQFIVRF
jgi:Helix-hairpin-helix motif